MDFDPSQPSEVVSQPSAFDPAKPSEFVGASSTTAPKPDWNSLYSGLDGLDQRLDETQKSTFTRLASNSQDPKEMQARAINQAYLAEQMPGMSPDFMAANWEAVKTTFAHEALGRIPGKQFSDRDLYGIINANLNDHLTAPEILSGLWEEVNKPFVQLASAPKNLPDLPNLGASNPALIGGVYDAVKPLLEGTTSLVGLATFGVGPALSAAAKANPMARATLAGMSALFASMMGHATVQASKEIPKVINDPNATFQEKVTAIATPVATGATALLSGLGAVYAALPAAKVTEIAGKLDGATPAEAAKVLREEAEAIRTAAAEPASPAPISAKQAAQQSDFLDHAANMFEEIADPAEVAANKAEATAPKAAEPVKPSAAEPAPAPEVSDAPAAEQATKSLTGIKNASVDAELEKMGLPKATHGEKLSFEEARADAAAKIEKDPFAGQKLVEELENKPRAISGKEDALVLHEVTRLKIERDQAERSLVDAVEANDKEAAQAARLRIAAARDAFQRASEVATKVGTENAQGLALRRMIMKEDYSLAAMERRRVVANDGRPLSPAQEENVRELHAKVEETQKAFDEYRSRMSEVLASDEPGKPASERKGPPSKVSAFISQRANEARARIKARLTEGRVSAGIDPAELADYAIVGADHLTRGLTKFADWSVAMVKEFGEKITPHLKDIFTQATHERSDAARKLSIAAKNDPEAIAKVLETKKKALETSIAKLEKKIAEGDLSKQAGKASRPSVKEVEALQQRRDELSRDLEGMREHANKVKELEAAIAEKEKKISSGDLSAKASAANRPNSKAIETLKQERDALNKDLEKARVDAAKPTADELTKRKVEAIQKAIDKVQEKLKSGDLSAESKAPQNRPAVQSVEEVRQELEALQKDLAKARREAAKPTEQEIVKRQVDAIEEKIAERKAALKSGDLSTEPRAMNRPQVRELEEAKQRLEAVNQEIADARKGPPKTPDEIRLAALKTRTAQSTAAMQEKLRTGDLKPKPRKPVPLDAEAIRLKAEHERVKKQVTLAELSDQQKNRTPMEKARDAFTSWVRAGALSYPTVLAKLTGAAIIRTVSTPLEQAVGYGVSKILPGLSKLAPREGVPEISSALKAEAKALTEGMTTGMKGAWDMLRNRDTDLAALFEKTHLPPSMVEYLGRIHGALKYPTKINEYARSLELRTAHALRNGVDPTEPLTQMRLMHEAYMDSNRAIFMQDNGVVDAYKAALATLERKDKGTGKPNAALQFLATGIRTELPIVKVPTNVIAEASQILTGAFTGPVKAAWAYAHGIENLKPAEADAILRLIKKGSIGLALTALGVFKANEIGGFYQKDEKRTADDIHPGEIKVGDATIPSQLLHNPYVTALHFGSTMERAASSRFKKSDHETKGEIAGLIAATMGLIEEVPFVRETTTIGKYMDPRTQGNALSEKAASILVPGVVQFAAAQMDKDQPFSPGETAHARKAEGLGETIQKKIPVLREDLPTGKTAGRNFKP